MLIFFHPLVCATMAHRNESCSLSTQAEGEVVDFQLLSDKDVIDIIAEAATFNEDGERTTLTYIAQFPVAKIPVSATTDEAVVAIVADAPEETPATEATNGEESTPETTPADAPVEKKPEVTPVIGEWVKLSLSAVDGDDADSTATIDVTAKHIAIQEAIAEKTAQMEKAVEEIAELQRRYKASQEAIVNEQKAAAKASTTSTTTKKKATTAAGKRKSTGKVTKKTTKSSQSSADDEDAEAAEEPSKQVAKKGFGLPSFGELQTYALNAGITALNVALTQRAVLFFAAAAIGVYTVGDYASV